MCFGASLTRWVMRLITLTLIGVSLTALIVSIMAMNTFKKEGSCEDTFDDVYKKLNITRDEMQYAKSAIGDNANLDRMLQIVVFTLLLVISAVFILRSFSGANVDDCTQGCLTFGLVLLTAAALIFQTLSIGVHIAFPYSEAVESLQTQLQMQIAGDSTSTVLTDACAPFRKRRTVVFILSLVSVILQGITAVVGHSFSRRRPEYDMTTDDYPIPDEVPYARAAMPPHNAYQPSHNAYQPSSNVYQPPRRGYTVGVCTKRG